MLAGRSASGQGKLETATGSGIQDSKGGRGVEKPEAGMGPLLLMGRRAQGAWKRHSPSEKDL